MRNKGKFAGRAMHIEYHTINPKKEKAADCVYLTNDRICQNPKSYYHLSKCFVASGCPLKVKEKDLVEFEKKKLKQTASGQDKEPKIIKMECTMPINCTVYSPKFGKGKFVGYNESSMVISVQFEDAVRRFQYPNAIMDKYLILPKTTFYKVLNDISKAKKG